MSVVVRGAYCVFPSLSKKLWIWAFYIVLCPLSPFLLLFHSHDKLYQAPPLNGRSLGPDETMIITVQ